MKAIPRNLVDSLHDRVKGDKMGDLALPPVDESISGLGRRSAAFGEKLLLAHGSKLDGDTLVIAREAVREQALERFTLADLTQYWSPGWTLERAGFGTTSGGKPGYGGTWLSGGVLTTWPRSEMRGVVLSKKLTIPTGTPHLVAEVGADPGRAWELAIFVGNTEVAKKSIIGGADKQIEWQTLDADLTAHAGKEITLRLYQNLATDHPPSVAHWKRISVK